MTILCKDATVSMDGYVTTLAAAAPPPPLVRSLHVTASNMLGFFFNFHFHRMVSSASSVTTSISMTMTVSRLGVSTSVAMSTVSTMASALLQKSPWVTVRSRRSKPAIAP
jgi:hypothetical protein